MEILRGKTASLIDSSALAGIQAAYSAVHIDIGTGDGRYVLDAARQHPRTLVIGIDSCRENLRDTSRRAPANALFVIANAEALPDALFGIASRISVNFPWGSLIGGLLRDSSPVLTGLAALAHTGTTLDVRVNAGALAEAGWSLQAGADRVRAALSGAGFALRPAVALTAAALRGCPTTWAKRLAFGRDPRAVWLRGVYHASAVVADVQLTRRCGIVDTDTITAVQPLQLYDRAPK